ncbi:MAG TPA: M2 family metallopeptidase [Candidatus Polarisedimenticolia bacterium]|nr:M2 family metallopeptidase [Candidatus Polarisedimenticolia bacterium]
MHPYWRTLSHRAVACAGLMCLAVSVGSLATHPHAAEPGPKPTVAQARAFVEEAERRLYDLSVKASRASWVQLNFITDDTEILAAEASKNLLAAAKELATGAARFNGLELPPDLARKLRLLKTSITVSAPNDQAKQTELSDIMAALESRYGRGQYCPKPGECLDLTKLSRIMAESRDPAQLLDAWRGWRTVSPPMRPQYRRFVELANEGSRDLGFHDLGALWRSGYDMPPDEFSAELDRLWKQVKPLYDALHCHTRASLARTYGAQLVPEGKPIPAHLLGNMWAQSWSNIYQLVAPVGSEAGYDLTQVLKSRNVAPLDMVKYGERFFTSLGFDPLPESFWQRSLFTKPADREVECHASAWDIDLDADLRIKMCIEINEEDFTTIHHELGHNFYQRAYNNLPMLYRDGANDGFHEGVGDTLALSITPEYLVEIGLLDKAPPASGDLGLLMRMALDKVAFLPFGLLVDQWRWKVFSGEIGPDQYNKAWWDLVREYQGIAPPVARSEEDFDPGAKYHVPAITPYTRYFLASILQFQFHRALCDIAGEKGPLHRCSIYGNKEAGARLKKMLEMGSSRPWPEALEALTGQRKMDATAMLDYFAPLKTWLDEQNKGRVCGW